MSVVMEISDHVVVLDYGQKISRRVRNDPKVSPPTSAWRTIARSESLRRGVTVSAVRTGRKRSSRKRRSGTPGDRSPHERAAAGRAGRQKLLRAHHGAQGHRPRRARGRDRHPDRGQRRRQVHPDDDGIRQSPRARRAHRFSRPRHHASADARDRAPEDRPVAGRPAHLPAHDRAREPADGRPGRRGRAFRGRPGAGVALCSRCSSSASISAAARSRAASSRCSPSPAR